MPNSTVPADAEAISFFSRSAIMKAAWDAYRRWHASKERTFGPRKFDRWQFSMLLRNAWRVAREAAMTPIQLQAERLQGQIDALQYKSFRYDIGAMRAGLTSELSALTA